MIWELNKTPAVILIKLFHVLHIFLLFWDFLLFVQLFVINQSDNIITERSNKKGTTCTGRFLMDQQKRKIELP